MYGMSIEWNYETSFGLTPLEIVHETGPEEDNATWSQMDKKP